MSGVRVSTYFGLVIRRSALERLGLDTETVLEVMGVTQPYDEDEQLLSFGPHFGEESAEEYVHRLRKLGLVYTDDFFVLWDDYPEWSEVRVSLDERKVS